MTALFFYLFSTLAVGSAFMVIAARNPVHSVLYLILTFVNAAGLFLLLGAEFLALILVVVYVGAVAVLFLFVVMMLDVDFAALRQGFLQYLPIGAVIGLIFAVELILVVTTWAAPHAISLDMALRAPGGVARAGAPPIPGGLTNTEALGRVIYTHYALFFQLAGLVLLVAMIGAIVLTLRERVGVRRQNISVQNARLPAEAVSVVPVPSRQGVPESLA